MERRGATKQFAQKAKRSRAGHTFSTRFCIAPISRSKCWPNRARLPGSKTNRLPGCEEAALVAREVDAEVRAWPRPRVDAVECAYACCCW